MSKFFLLILIILYSCGYPDVDSVPDSNNFELSTEELMDLCNSESSDNNILCNNFNKN